MTVITRQQQRLDGLLQQHASPMPLPHRRRPWLLVGAGVAIGVLLGGGHRWLIAPINPAPQAETCPQLRFKLANPADLEPRLTAQQWVEFQQNLGPQLPQSPAPASPPPASEPSC